MHAEVLATPLISRVMEASLATHLLLRSIVIEYHLHNLNGGCLKVFHVPCASTHDRIPLHHKGIPYHGVVTEIPQSHIMG